MAAAEKDLYFPGKLLCKFGIVSAVVAQINVAGVGLVLGPGVQSQVRFCKADNTGETSRIKGMVNVAHADEVVVPKQIVGKLPECLLAREVF